MIRQYMMLKVIPQLLQALNQTGKIPVRASDQDLYLFSLFYAMHPNKSGISLQTQVQLII